MSKSVPLIIGKILFSGDVEPFTDAVVYVRLEDASRLDAPSKLVAQQVLERVSYRPGCNTGLEFTIYGDPPEKRSGYIVRAHVDVDKDGEVSIGDYVTEETYPVLASSHPDYVTLNVRKVG